MHPTPAPRFAQIEPTGHCNLRCRMCPVRYRETRGAFMDWDLYIRILEQLPDLEELHLQGLGEPLLHPRFFEMAAVAAGRGVRVTVNTNLTVLSAAGARRLASCGLQTIFVSVDGADAPVYEWIREGARFAHLERNMARLMSAAGSAAAPRVELVAVAMRENLDQLAALVRLAARWNVGSVHVQQLCHDYGESALPARYLPMRAFVADQTLMGVERGLVERAFAAARAAAAEHGVRLRLPPAQSPERPAPARGERRCDWPWRGPYITYDGTVMPCCIAATPDRASIGSLADTPLETLWNGDAYAAFREALDSASPPELCRSCSVYRHAF